MNRKQKIIVSTTGIFLVLLILVGLTYAYFLTRINGNTNDKSISVSTAKLELTYGDNSAEILGKDLVLEPSDKEIGTKTFTVTNNGNDTSYVVVIENVSITKTSDGTTTTFESNDFRYTLTCTKSDGSNCDGVSTQSIFPINGGVLVGNSIKEGDVHTYAFKMWYIDTGIDQSNDMGKTIQARLNITNIASMTNPYSANTNSLAYNIIENAKNKTNGTELLSSPKTKVAEEISYTKIIKSITREKELDMTVTSYWYYKSDKNTSWPWAGGPSSNPVSICDDTIIGKYITFYDADEDWYIKSCKNSETAIFEVQENQYDYEKVLSVAADDYGISYYYRGNVIDNYVNFAGMCWRIVRIAGDGSIKLILEDQDNTCATSDGNWDIPTTTGGTIKHGNFGYTQYDENTLTASDGTQNSKKIYLMNYLNGETNNDESMATAFKNFQTGPLASYLSFLKTGDWCLNDKAYATETDNTTPLTSQEILDKKIKGEKIYYDSYVRLKGKTIKEPTLKCNGTNMGKFVDNTAMYVGTLTADEIAYAGSSANDGNYGYYLSSFVSLSPAYFANNGRDYFFNQLSYLINVDGGGTLRPAISLKYGIQISGGNGTKENPYVVN